MTDYPYETHLDIKFAPLEVIDVYLQMAARNRIF